jgi:hypothetical protein
MCIVKLADEVAAGVPDDSPMISPPAASAPTAT